MCLRIHVLLSWIVVLVLTVFKTCPNPGIPLMCLFEQESPPLSYAQLCSIIINCRIGILISQISVNFQTVFALFY